MVLTLAGGAIFGPVLGVLLNWIGASCGAACSFLITRHLLYDWFSKRRGAKLNKLIAGVEQKGWVFIAFLRLVPIIPFSLVNSGLGLTRIKFRLYLLVSTVFLIPVEIIYTYFGYAGIDALSRPEHFYKSGGIILSFLALLFLAILMFLKKSNMGQWSGEEKETPTPHNESALSRG